MVLSGLTEVLIWTNGSLLASRCMRLGQLYPMVKTSFWIHFTQHRNPQDIPPKGHPTSYESKRAPPFPQWKPL